MEDTRGFIYEWEIDNLPQVGLIKVLELNEILDLTVIGAMLVHLVASLSFGIASLVLYSFVDNSFAEEVSRRILDIKCCCQGLISVPTFLENKVELNLVPILVSQLFHDHS